jgi:DNA-binding transcriptional LysR family regulator
MSDRLRELAAFVRVAETGSFSRVAKEFGVSQPSVSRMVADVESRLGVKLLLRTTRRVTPTDGGKLFLQRVRQILSDLEEAENAARDVESLHGTLRIAMSGAFGTREVIPNLKRFMTQHPKLRLDFVVSDRTDDLVAEGIDMALRLGPLRDSGFGVRLLGKAPRFVVAAPGYLAQRGIPKTPTDLSSHDCITGPGLSGRTGWTFSHSGALTSVTVAARVQVGTAEAAVACAKAGLGIALASWWMCKAEFETGELIPILADYQLDAVELHAVYPAGRRPSLKVRAFSDFLASSLATSPSGPAPSSPIVSR